MQRDPKTIALMFNDCINAQDLDALTALMVDDYTFIDTTDAIHAGKEQMTEAWRMFFEKYPDYRNHFHTVISRENVVFMLGNSVCSFEPLDGPAIWEATIRESKVSKWRIYVDSPENRQKFNLPN